MRKKEGQPKACGRNRAARQMNGFTQGGESQPFPLVHRAIGDSRLDLLLGLVGTRSYGQEAEIAGNFGRIVRGS